MVLWATHASVGAVYDRAFFLLLPSVTSALPSGLGGRGFEALLVLVDVSEVTLWVDKRIRISGASLLELGVLIGHVVERGVGTDP